MVIFHIPVRCPNCGLLHFRYVNQTMPLFMDAWQVKNVNRCPPKHGGCGKEILVKVKPLTACLKEKTVPSAPDVDIIQFVEEVNELYFDEHGEALFNVYGALVKIKAQIIVMPYDKETCREIVTGVRKE